MPCIATLIDGIASVTAGQSEGIFRVGTAVTSIDQMTQQNAALVGQRSAATAPDRSAASGLSVPEVPDLADALVHLRALQRVGRICRLSPGPRAWP